MSYTTIPIKINQDNSLSVNTRNLQIHQGDYEMYQLGLETNVDYSTYENQVDLRVSFRRADGLETPYLNFIPISGKRYYLNLQNRWFTNVAGNLYITIQAYSYTQEEVINIIYSGSCTLAILPVASFNPIEDILPTTLDMFRLEMQDALDNKLNKDFTTYDEDLSITGDELVAVNNTDGSVKTIRTNLLVDTVRTVNNIEPDANKNITITGDNIDVSGTDSATISSKLNTNEQNIQTNTNDISIINSEIDVLDNRIDSNDSSISTINDNITEINSSLDNAVYFNLTGEEDDITISVAEKAYNDGNGNNIVNTYATKTELNTAETNLETEISTTETRINNKITTDISTHNTSNGAHSSKFSRYTPTVDLIKYTKNILTSPLTIGSTTASPILVPVLNGISEDVSPHITYDVMLISFMVDNTWFYAYIRKNTNLETQYLNAEITMPYFPVLGQPQVGYVTYYVSTPVYLGNNPTVPIGQPLVDGQYIQFMGNGTKISKYWSIDANTGAITITSVETTSPNFIINSILLISGGVWQ